MQSESPGAPIEVLYVRNDSCRLTTFYASRSGGMDDPMIRMFASRCSKHCCVPLGSTCRTIRIQKVSSIRPSGRYKLDVVRPSRSLHLKLFLSPFLLSCLSPSLSNKSHRNSTLVPHASSLSRGARPTQGSKRIPRPVYMMKSVLNLSHFTIIIHGSCAYARLCECAEWL